MTAYRRPRRVAHVAGDGDLPELHLMVLPDGQVHTLTGSGMAIWSIATEGSTDVPGEVAAVFGADVELIRGDVLAFVDELVGLGLLEADDATP